MPDVSTVQLPPVPPDIGGPPELITTPPGRHHRGWRVALIAAVAVLVLAIPLVLILVLGGDSGRPGIGTPGPGPTTTANAGPSGPAGASPTATATAGALDGRISAGQLANATLDIPAWPTDNVTCRSGPVTFRSGWELDTSQYLHNRNAMLSVAASRGPVYGDVDRDGAAETVIRMFCVGTVEGGSSQVLALDRTAGCLTVVRVRIQPDRYGHLR